MPKNDCILTTANLTMTRLKRIFIFALLITGLNVFSQTFNYSFNSFASAFTPVPSGSVLIHPASTDDALSPAINIGFNFQYNCNDYSVLRVSSNGVIFLGNTAIGTNPLNNLNTSTDRPSIAPLWDDMQCDVTGQVSYFLSGVSPNQVLTIEWLNMRWGKSQKLPVISFQTTLYESSNVLEFIYRQEAAAVNGTQ